MFFQIYVQLKELNRIVKILLLIIKWLIFCGWLVIFFVGYRDDDLELY